MWIYVRLCFVFNYKLKPRARGPFKHSQSHSVYTMSSKLSSVVWQLAKIDEDNKELAWCLIKDRNECTKPIRRGGTNARNFSTGIVKRHFEKYHPKELANAQKKNTGRKS